MKNFLIIIVCLSSLSVFANEVHLDCQTKVTEILGENLYGRSSYKVGEDKLWKFDINLENETGKVPGWDSNTYSSNPNNPTYLLTIGEKQITFGQMNDKVDYKHTFKIDREDLSFFGMASFGWTAVFRGNCELIEKREAPKRAF